MDVQQLRDEAFQRLRVAELNEAYYRGRAAALGTWDVRVRIFGAITASGAFAAWAGTAMGAPTWVLASLSLVSAISAITSATYRLADRAREYRDLSAKWSAVAADLELLDMNVRSGAVTDEAPLSGMVRRMGELQAADVEEPDQVLLRRCQQLVNARHTDRVPLIQG